MFGPSVALAIGAKFVPLRKPGKLTEEIGKLFPCIFGQPSVSLVPDDSGDVAMIQSLKFGVVLSGGQAPGGHNLVYEKKSTLKNVTDYIADAICKRSESGYNYGVILIPGGLIDFISEVIVRKWDQMRRDLSNYLKKM